MSKITCEHSGIEFESKSESECEKKECWCKRYKSNHSIIELEKKIHQLIEHKNWQIDENRKISRRVDEIEEMQKKMLSMPNIIWAKYNKIPYRCPVCEGKGQWFEPPQDEFHCTSCNGTGIIWG